jgi:hypothetical protein
MTGCVYRVSPISATQHQSCKSGSASRPHGLALAKLSLNSGEVNAWRERRPLKRLGYLRVYVPNLPPRSLDQLNKVVVAFLDKRRQRGYTYDFSPMRDSFNILPPENPLQGKGERLELKNLKAVFFVRDFVGDKNIQDRPDLDSLPHGRKLEVLFADGEKLLGKTEGYNPQKIGFFVLPADPKSNNLRIFVIIKNASYIKFL